MGDSSTESDGRRRGDDCGDEPVSLSALERARLKLLDEFARATQEVFDETCRYMNEHNGVDEVVKMIKELSTFFDKYNWDPDHDPALVFKRLLVYYTLLATTYNDHQRYVQQYLEAVRIPRGSSMPPDISALMSNEHKNRQIQYKLKRFWLELPRPQP